MTASMDKLEFKDNAEEFVLKIIFILKADAYMLVHQVISKIQMVDVLETQIQAFVNSHSLDKVVLALQHV